MDDNYFEGESGNKWDKSLNTHPLLIPVILDLIIDYLPFHVLKTSRLISKLWNETVTSSKKFQFKLRKFVEFGYGRKYQLDYANYSLGAMDGLADCLSCSLRTRNFQLHYFIVVTSGTQVDSKLKEFSLVNFLNAVSPMTQKLLIQHDCELEPLGKNEAANWGVFPKLKYLKLKLYKPQLGIIWEFLGHLMCAGNAPQLEKLHIRWKPLNPLQIPDSSVFKLISTINVPATTSKLMSLKLKSPLQLQHLRELKALELNLSEFHVEVKNISDLEAASTVRSILEKQSNTLSKLKLTDWQDGYRNVHAKVVIFPKMPKLEALSIYTEKIIFVNMRLNERFPALKSLIFKGSSSPWNEFFGEEIQPILSIDEIGVTRRFTDETILHKAIQYFPNIRKLQIPAVSNMTNVVFDKMSHLEELTLDTTDILCIDDIITGMTLKECEDALGRMTDWRKNVEVLANISDIRLTTRPICCLTKLKTLRLYSLDDEMLKNTREIIQEFRKRKVEITKLSYLMVLMNMDSLRCIDFGERRFAPNYQLQPSVWRRVSEKFEVICTTKRPDVGLGYRQ